MAVFIEIFCAGFVLHSAVFFIRFLVKAFTGSGCKGDCKTCGGCRKKP